MSIVTYQDIMTEEMIYGFITTLKRFHLSDAEIDSVISDIHRLDYFPKMIVGIPDELKSPEIIKAIVMSIDMNFSIYRNLTRK
ncbi:hypothetical protein [Ruminobacter amylophilus]|uniref:hypothetical protein n=1 Tax=Ruminobacter amylophilus TaxID=867 RepID=UPI0038666832